MTDSVEFRSDKDWRGRGAPPIIVPEEIQVWMERTYRDNTFAEIPCNPAAQEVKDFIRLCNVYAKRQHKRLQHQFIERDDTTFLRVRMREPRPYSRPLPREKPK